MLNYYDKKWILEKWKKKKIIIIFTLYKVTVININLHSIHDKETLYNIIIQIFKQLIMTGQEKVTF